MRPDFSIRVRVARDVKDAAQSVFEDNGLDLSAGVNLFLDYVAKNKCLPFYVPKEDQFASLFADVLNENKLPYMQVESNLWIVNQKIVVGICVRNIKRNGARIISADGTNRFIKRLAQISRCESLIPTICFIWTVDGSDQKCALVPLNDFEDIPEDATYAERQKLVAYRAVQTNAIDYRLRIRDQDMQWIEEKTNETLIFAKEK